MLKRRVYNETVKSPSILRRVKNETRAILRRVKNRTWALAGVVALLVALVGLAAAFPEKALNLALREALRHFPELGLQVDLTSVSLREIALTVSIPSRGIRIAGVRPKVRIERVFPLAAHVTWDERLPAVDVGGESARDVAISLEARYAGLGRGWSAKASVRAGAYGKLTGLDATASLDEDDAALDARFNAPAGPVSLAAKGRYRHDHAREEMQGELAVVLDAPGVRYEGPVSFRAEEEANRVTVESGSGKSTLHALALVAESPRWKVVAASSGNGAREIDFSLDLPVTAPLPGDAKIAGKLRLPRAATEGETKGARALAAASGGGKGSWSARDPKSVLPKLAFSWEASGSEPYRLAVTLPREGARVRLPFAEPFGIGGSLTAQLEEKTRKIAMTAALKDDRGLVSAKGRGAWDLEGKKGDFSLEAPLTLKPDLDLATVAPVLEGKVAAVSGTVRVAARGSASLGARPDLRVTATAEELSATVAGVPLEGVSLTAAAAAFPEPALVGRQRVRVRKVGQKGFLESVQVEVDGNGARELVVRRAEAKLPGGSIEALPFTVRLPSGQFSTTVSVRNADAEKLLAALNYENLSGKGTFHGKIPLGMMDGTLYVHDGELANDGPGVVRYKDATITSVQEKIDYLNEFEDLMQQGQQALAFKALDNFHYDTLVVDVDRDGHDKLSVALHLKGTNPDIAGGQKFELNMPITGDLESLLVESLLKSMMENDAWEKRIESARHGKH